MITLPEVLEKYPKYLKKARAGYYLGKRSLYKIVRKGVPKFYWYKKSPGKGWTYDSMATKEDIEEFEKWEKKKEKQQIIQVKTKEVEKKDVKQEDTDKKPSDAEIEKAPTKVKMYWTDTRVTDKRKELSDISGLLTVDDESEEYVRKGLGSIFKFDEDQEAIMKEMDSGFPLGTDGKAFEDPLFVEDSIEKLKEYKKYTGTERFKQDIVDDYWANKSMFDRDSQWNTKNSADIIREFEFKTKLAVERWLDALERHNNDKIILNKMREFDETQAYGWRAIGRMPNLLANSIFPIDMMMENDGHTSTAAGKKFFKDSGLLTDAQIKHFDTSNYSRITKEVHAMIIFALHSKGQTAKVAEVMADSMTRLISRDDDTKNPDLKFTAQQYSNLVGYMQEHYEEAERLVSSLFTFQRFDRIEDNIKDTGSSKEDPYTLLHYDAGLSFDTDAGLESIREYSKSVMKSDMFADKKDHKVAQDFSAIYKFLKDKKSSNLYGVSIEMQSQYEKMLPGMSEAMKESIKTPEGNRLLSMNDMYTRGVGVYVIRDLDLGMSVELMDSESRKGIRRDVGLIKYKTFRKGSSKKGWKTGNIDWENETKGETSSLKSALRSKFLVGLAMVPNYSKTAMEYKQYAEASIAYAMAQNWTVRKLGRKKQILPEWTWGRFKLHGIGNPLNRTEVISERPAKYGYAATPTQFSNANLQDAIKSAFEGNIIELVGLGAVQVKGKKRSPVIVLKGTGDAGRAEWEDKLRKDWTHGGGYSASDVKVHNVLEIQYHNYYDKYKDQETKLGNIEYMYTGTSFENAANIIKGGFEIGRTQANGNLLGLTGGKSDGIYLAKSFSKSAQYLRGAFGRRGHGVILVCRVALGKVNPTGNSDSDKYDASYNTMYGKKGVAMGGTLQHDEWMVRNPMQAIPIAWIDVGPK